MYADDNTPTISHSDPCILLEQTQSLANDIVNWFVQNDMVVSGDKTKFLILGTRANRRLKIEENLDFHSEVLVDQQSVPAVHSEKLLGVIVNDYLNWKAHLDGNNEHCGLLSDLSRRIGVLKHLRNYLPSSKLKQVVSGIFTSKLIYCMSVWTGIWGLGGQQEDVTRSTISKEDMRRLQVLQNKAMRLITKCDRWTPTSTLLGKTSFLSVHQLGAYHTALQVFKTHLTRKLHITMRDSLEETGAGKICFR